MIFPKNPLLSKKILSDKTSKNMIKCSSCGREGPYKHGQCSECGHNKLKRENLESEEAWPFHYPGED